jgi:hypothetical protein
VAAEIIQITPQFRKEDKHTSQTFTFDGVRFTLDTYTNRADGSWYMDLSDSVGVPIVIGIALVTGLDLLYPYRYLPVPAGVLFINDLAGPRQDPGLDSFEDEEVALYYQNAESAAL